MSGPMVLGADVGGTTIRMAVATPHGRLAELRRMAGANPYAVGAEAAVDRLAEALRGTVQGLDPGSIAMGVLAIAGWDTADAALASGLADAWRASGLTCPYVLVSDLEVAFASVSPTPDGVVLVAGTGSAAARIGDWRTLQTADGFGWLVGDEGSAFWLGRQAVARTLAALDGRGPATLLVDAITRSLGVATDASRPPNEIARQLIRVVYGQPPVALAAIAPCVTDAADAGDGVARGLIREAADALLSTLRAVMPADDRPPTVVLGGSVLSVPNALGTLVQHDLQQAGMVARSARDGLEGALALAFRSVPAQTGDEAPTGAR